MELHALLDLIEKAVASGAAALAVVILVAVYQTRELRACRRRDEACADNLHRTRVAIARMHSVLKARLGEPDPLPGLDELLNDRRNPQT